MPQEIREDAFAIILDIPADAVFPITAPVEIAPMYLSGVNEVAWCLLNGIGAACIEANHLANVANDATRANFPANTHHNGHGDAFRHCYWNARMERNFWIPDGVAEMIATRHEDRAPNQPANERTMDLRKNAIGRGIGRRVDSNTAALNTCRNDANGGRLWILRNGVLVQAAS